MKKNFLNMFHFCIAGFLLKGGEEGMRGGKAKFLGNGRIKKGGVVDLRASLEEVKKKGGGRRKSTGRKEE